jgi:hypothetical protein
LFFNFFFPIISAPVRDFLILILIIS